MARQNTRRSGKDAGGGGATGGGGKRGMPAGGWEKGDIVRDVVIQPDDPGVPRKPGSRREDRTIEIPENSDPAATATEQPREGQDQ
jgi:hypothetical protein